MKLGYAQGKYLFSYVLNDDNYDYEDIKNYYITIDKSAYVDSFAAKKLGIPHQKYIEILSNCGSIRDFNGNTCFKNEDDAIKAIVMLQLII